MDLKIPQPQQYFPFTCRRCGKTADGHWAEGCQKRLMADGSCFNCNFWIEKIEIRDRPNVVRVKGQHHIYKADLPAKQPWPAGNGGSEYRIRFLDGREVTTCNLWNQGDIPEWIRHELPDNAEFIRG